MFLHVLQVIFSNESNIERWSKSRQKAVDSKLGRLEAFMKVVEVPMQVGGHLPGLLLTFLQPLFICQLLHSKPNFFVRYPSPPRLLLWWIAYLFLSKRSNTFVYDITK